MGEAAAGAVEVAGVAPVAGTFAFFAGDRRAAGLAAGFGARGFAAGTFVSADASAEGDSGTAAFGVVAFGVAALFFGLGVVESGVVESVRFLAGILLWSSRANE